jgi:glutamate--cysteine ligase
MTNPLDCSQALESRTQLIEHFERGNKPRAKWRIGTEHEKFTFYRDGCRPVPYQGTSGIRTLLERLMSITGWLPEFDGEHIIVLKDPTTGAAISLEPGGQFELSGAPLATLHQTNEELEQHIFAVREAAEPLGIGFLGLGVIPTWTVDEIPAVPKSRYKIMQPYMERVGALGTSMMFRSSTVQVNLDFESEQDMVRKLRTSVALQPIATALFANSPFSNGARAPFLSYRSHIWLNTDGVRTGMMPFAFESGMGFERYADYALDVPMYFVVRNGQYINCAGESFREFLDGRLPQLPGQVPTLQDWESHLSTLFPEVRLKQYLEMRGADAGMQPAICALSAFWTGLLYDETALDAAWNLVRQWTPEQRQSLREAVPTSALHAKVDGIDVLTVAREVVELARMGLEARGNFSSAGCDEQTYLQPLQDILETGETAADRLVVLYDGEWRSDLSRAFVQYSF